MKIDFAKAKQRFKFMMHFCKMEKPTTNRKCNFYKIYYLEYRKKANETSTKVW